MAGQVRYPLIGVSPCDGYRLLVPLRVPPGVKQIDGMTKLRQKRLTIEVSCEDEARDIFEMTDANGNGVIDEREFAFESGEDPIFDSVDMNGDGEIEFREALQEICSCENEILIIASQLSPFSDGITLKEFSQLDLKNTIFT